MKIIKLTDGNEKVIYKIKPTFFGIKLFGYYWSNGEIGACGEDFTLEGVRKFVKSLEIKRENVLI